MRARMWNLNNSDAILCCLDPINPNHWPSTLLPLQWHLGILQAGRSWAVFVSQPRLFPAHPSVLQNSCRKNPLLQKLWALESPPEQFHHFDSCHRFTFICRSHVGSAHFFGTTKGLNCLEKC